VADVVISSSAGRPVRVGDVADVVDGDAEPTAYVSFQTTRGRRQSGRHDRRRQAQGTNAIDVSRRVSRNWSC
jgi:multidrug efflux pump subunit AcrB